MQSIIGVGFQVVAFLVNLSQLRSLQPLHPSTTRKMNELYHLDDSKNAEIRAAWYQLCINAGTAPCPAEIHSNHCMQQYHLGSNRAQYHGSQASRQNKFSRPSVCLTGCCQRWNAARVRSCKAPRETKAPNKEGLPG